MNFIRTLAALAMLSTLALAQQPSGQDPTGHGQSPNPNSSVTTSNSGFSQDRKTDFAPAGSALNKEFKVNKSAAFQVAHKSPARDPFKKRK